MLPSEHDEATESKAPLESGVGTFWVFLFFFVAPILLLLTIITLELVKIL